MRWLVPVMLMCSACIRVPEIVMVDRATALEEQAAGSFEELEERLYRAGMSPTPVPFTPDQLEALGIKPTPLVENLDQTPADRLDELLRRHCVGEGLDGLLVDSKQCRRPLSASDVALVDRVNQARQQLWKWMQERAPQTPDVSVRQAWHHTHLEGVVCGGWVQLEGGTWGEKKC